MNSNIRFFSEEINFTLKKKTVTRNWLTDVIREELKTPLNINYIFCTDEYLSELNKKYLNHTTLTDIITFPEISNPKKISGEIYISVDRIKENAEQYQETFDNELARVMVHGILHLLGYKDKTPFEKELMTSKEDYYLKKFLLF